MGGLTLDANIIILCIYVYGYGYLILPFLHTYVAVVGKVLRLLYYSN